MSKYLISTVETYRVDSENEAKTLIDEAKKERVGEVTKYGCIQKQQKAKGEVVQEWYRVTLTKVFNDEKEPYSVISANYKIGEGESYE